MMRHGENFSKFNKDQIDGILTPLKEKLGEFERNVQASQVKSTEERATLAEQIRHVAATSAVMGKETKELTEALRGRSQMQGAWGEMILNTVLENSGLRADEEYVLQKSFADEDGGRLRPDVVVNLPSSTAQPQPRPDKPVYVTMRADGSLAVGDAPVTADALGAAGGWSDRLACTPWSWASSRRAAGRSAGAVATTVR